MDVHCVINFICIWTIERQEMSYREQWEFLENQSERPTRLRNVITMSYADFVFNVYHDASEMIANSYAGDTYLIKNAFTK